MKHAVWPPNSSFYAGEWENIQTVQMVAVNQCVLNAFFFGIVVDARTTTLT